MKTFIYICLAIDALLIWICPDENKGMLYPYYFGVGGVLILILIVMAVYKHNVTEKCPKCKKAGALELYKQDIINERQIERLEDHDRRGNPCTPYYIHGTEYTYKNYYRCKYCGYKTTDTSYGEEWNY